ncbi:hypothetical protein L7F22_059487 [Adiantum nelumboides]|nr:hypothetical protein [Adiantum nelumboides]
MNQFLMYLDEDYSTDASSKGFCVDGEEFLGVLKTENQCPGADMNYSSCEDKDLQFHVPEVQVLVSKVSDLQSFKIQVPDPQTTDLQRNVVPEFAEFQSLFISRAEMINNLSLELENERHSSMVVTNEAVSKIRQLQKDKASLMVEISQDNQIEDLNLQLTRIKNMEFSSNLDIVEGILNDDVVLDYLYDIGALTNSVMEIGNPPFSKEVQFPDGILEDLYSLCGSVPDVNVLNGVYDAQKMVLTDDYASLLQVIDDGEVGFPEDGSFFLCDVVSGGDDVDVLISHWFYVFMLDDIRKEIRKNKSKVFRFYEVDYVDLKVEASCVIEMYQKAAVFVSMKSVMEEVSALEEVPSSLELPEVLKLANVFSRKLWFSRAQPTMLVESFDSNQDTFEIVYVGGFLKLTNQEQRRNRGRLQCFQEEGMSQIGAPEVSADPEKCAAKPGTVRMLTWQRTA